LTDVFQKGFEKTVEDVAYKVAKDKAEDAIATVEQKVENVVTTVAGKVESAVTNVVDAAEKIVGGNGENVD
jgi:hypothetical protein